MEFSFSCKLFILLLILPTTSTSAANSIYQECSKNYSITLKAMLHDNINHALMSLVAKTTLDGFSTATYGLGIDTIYGLTRCRGDIDRETCSKCILDAAHKIRTICPVSSEAQIMYEQCFLRYDSGIFYGQFDTTMTQTFYTSKIAADRDSAAFDQTVGMLMEAVKVPAAKAVKKFAWRQSNDLKNKLTVYGMAQCNRDLKEEGCNQCLGELSVRRMRDCRDFLGCNLLSPSCVLRYDTSNFLVAPKKIDGCFNE